MVVNWRLRARIGDGKKFNIPVKILATAVTGELLKVIKFLYSSSAYAKIY